MAQACVMAPPRPQDQLLTPGKQPISPQPDNSLITSTVRKRKGDAPHPQYQATATEEGKRQRTPSVDRGLAQCDASVHLLVSPAAATKAPPAAAPDRQQPGPSQHQRGQQQAGTGAAAAAAGCAQHQQQQQHEQQEDEAVLFSPLFHLHKEGSRDDLSAHTVGDLLQLDAPADAAAAADTPPGQAAQAQQQPQAQQGQGQAPARQETENASTDRSTGTSASLADPDASSADAAASRPAVASPMPATATAAACPEAAAGAAQAAAQAEEDGEGEEYLEFDPLLFIKRLPPLECCVPPRRDFLLPKKTRRSKQKTLVLDLDETLVHSTLDGYCRPDFTFPVEVGSMRHMVSVRRRPHLHTFLERVAQLYEVVVFTASQRVYAEQLLDIVDPERRLVRHRVYRDSCVFWEGNYLKDLTVLGRDLAHTIIVDNSPQAFGFQLDNGIPIESWYDDDGDQELLKLIPFLEQVAGADDVRPHIERRYRLRSLVEAAADPDPQAYQLLQH